MIPTYTCGCLKALKIMDLCVGWISAKPINPKNKKMSYMFRDVSRGSLPHLTQKQPQDPQKILISLV